MFLHVAILQSLLPSGQRSLQTLRNSSGSLHSHKGDDRNYFPYFKELEAEMPRISKVFSAACNKLWESLKEKLPGDSELESNTLNCIASSGPLTLLPSKDDDGWSLPWSASCHLQG